MALNFKILRSFVTAVETTSLSAAANALKVAQPALSQQIAVLESHFAQKLLLRSNTGVVPTAAGRELYRHAKLMLDQLERAERDVARHAGTVSGTVSVGLATYSTTSILSTPLLKAVRENHPGIRLFINDNFGLVLSEMVMTGRMDMAIIYAPSQLAGVQLEPMLVEELFFIAPPGTVLPAGCEATIPLAVLAGMELLLPGRTHYLRRLIESAFASAQLQPRVTAEIESAATLREAIEAGLGATILPWALASTFAGPALPVIRRVIEPSIETTVSLCVSAQQTMSEPALIVRDILGALVHELVETGRCVGVRAPAGAAAA
ncbi:LysR substrate-binding domain-containing protein [Aquabacterium sp.]|uniref:LysR substrate-binding domain-containing protein n=1 Tax=Aquabacterium sp. TaxID=1872578 RepID=UPI002C65B2E5|nr:LysR substrate-binding domain-containing protein [Aquabacterium sp.]HSW03996.1 LysR substrate-binding domain-containing protein [Aquabacterium sp.]